MALLHIIVCGCLFSRVFCHRNLNSSAFKREGKWLYAKKKNNEQIISILNENIEGNHDNNERLVSTITGNISAFAILRSGGLATRSAPPVMEKVLLLLSLLLLLLLPPLLVIAVLLCAA